MAVTTHVVFVTRYSFVYNTIIGTKQHVQLRLGQTVGLVAGVRACLGEGGENGRHHTGTIIPILRLG